MKLIYEIVHRRLEVSKDYGLNGEHVKEMWCFYEIYKICINFLGISDNLLKKKILIINTLITEQEDLILLNKLRNYMAQDSKIVELLLNSIKDNEEEVGAIEDFYPCNLIGVNVYDR